MYESGPAFRELSSCRTDVQLLLLDREMHMFMRTDRRVMAVFGTNFDGQITHFFMNPTPSLAFRKLRSWETLRSTRLIFLLFMLFYFSFAAAWVLLSTPSLLPWFWMTSDNDEIPVLCVSARCVEYPHVDVLQELGSWLMVMTAIVNVVFIVALPRVVASCRSGGAIEDWYASGPPLKLKVFLLLPVVNLVLTKALLVMSVLIWTAEWHARPVEPTNGTPSPVGAQLQGSQPEMKYWLAWERLTSSAVAVVNLVFGLYLDSWNLVGYRWG
eukprot:SAG31_NODE_1520_length_8024_cov_7.506625_4_plen_270_part_00